MRDLGDKLSASADAEFKRGAINGIIFANFIQDPRANHQDRKVQSLLDNARSMPDPSGWLVAHLWFEELERLKPEFMQRQNSGTGKPADLSVFSRMPGEELPRAD